MKTYLMTAQVNAADDRVTHEVTASNIHEACDKMRAIVTRDYPVFIITHWDEIA